MTNRNLLDSLIRRDLEAVRNIIAAARERLEIAEAFVAGSFAHGTPVYDREAERAISDLDLVLVVMRPRAGHRLPDLARLLADETGLSISLAALTFEELAVRPPSQFWWETAWAARSLLDNGPPQALRHFIDYVPTVYDARRLLVNRFADLSIEAERREILAIKSIRAALDALAIADGWLPARIADRPRASIQLGPVWGDECELYAEFVANPFIDAEWAARLRNDVSIAPRALARAGRHIPRIGELGHDALGPREQMRRHLRLLRRAAPVLSLCPEQGIHERIARALLAERKPSRRALRAWSSFNH